MTVDMLEKELRSFLKPVFDQLVYYSQSIKEIRSLLQAYFTDAEWSTLISDEAKSLSIPFSFETLTKALDVCLIDEQQLREVYLQRQTSARTGFQSLSLAETLDFQVVKSSLPLAVSLTGQYEILPSENCPPQLFAYLNKLSQALTLYRYSLEILENYEQLTQFSCFDLSEYKRFEVRLNHFKNSLIQPLPDDKDALMKLYRQARSIKSDINQFFSRSYQGMDLFQQFAPNTRLALDAAISLSATYLERTYQEVSVKGFSAMYRDDRFQVLLRGLAKQLYANKYNYSLLYGSLAVYKTPIEFNRRELDQCIESTLLKWPKAKIQFIKSAGTDVNYLMLEIKVKAAELNIDLSKMNKSALMRESIFERYLPAARSLNSSSLPTVSSSSEGQFLK